MGGNGQGRVTLVYKYRVGRLPRHNKKYRIIEDGRQQLKMSLSTLNTGIENVLLNAYCHIYKTAAKIFALNLTDFLAEQMLNC